MVDAEADENQDTQDTARYWGVGYTPDMWIVVVVVAEEGVGTRKD